MQISVAETDTDLEFTAGRVEIFIEWWPTNHHPQPESNASFCNS